MLLSVFPAKIMLESDEIAEVPEATAEFLRFLGGRFPDTTEDYEGLAEAEASRATHFVSAMADESTWRLRQAHVAHRQGRGGHLG